MARETKVGLLIGVGVILLIGIIISDHLSVVRKSNPSAAWTDFGNNAQRSIYSDSNNSDSNNGQPANNNTQLAPSNASSNTAANSYTDQPLPTPQELDQPQHQQVTGRLPQNQNTPSRPKQPVSVMQLGSTQPRAQSHDQPSAAPASQTQIASTHEIDQPAPSQQRSLTTQSPPRTTADATSPAAANGEIIHQVKAGENLYQIAKQYYNNGRYWKSIANANPGKVSPNGRVRVGVKLLIPNRAGLANTKHNSAAGITKTARTIQVKPGDTLFALAHQYLGSAARWHKLLAANSNLLHGSAKNLRPGMTLTVPSLAAAHRAATTKQHAASKQATVSHYTVQPHDTLMKIARKTLGSRAKWKAIYHANRDKIKSPNQLPIGTVLEIPAS